MSRGCKRGVGVGGQRGGRMAWRAPGKRLVWLGTERSPMGLSALGAGERGGFGGWRSSWGLVCLLAVSTTSGGVRSQSEVSKVTYLQSVA